MGKDTKRHFWRRSAGTVIQRTGKYMSLNSPNLDCRGSNFADHRIDASQFSLIPEVASELRVKFCPEKTETANYINWIHAEEFKFAGLC
ncbi:hypothetical protein CLV84_3474 [Neolewinella xylanilytica]|uniref:Uncharacterized protein n=1 Tax=Neolewinella xylanilytica TaxID=1514080 RepID=A0A2S6I5V2_9BACT|nr:hypothetical protein CLV84_3474 [Neolewinella xylanilytica]